MPKLTHSPAPWNTPLPYLRTREMFQQAYREIRANGRIGYAILGAPRIRMAAAECMRFRLTEDEMYLARRRYTNLESELFWRRQP